MKLSKDDLNTLCRMAVIAAKEAGHMIANNAGNQIEYKTKAGGDSLASQVVTQVDRQSQAIILEQLNPTLKQYDLGLLAEESVDDGSRFEKDYFWSIDPMDGTLPFIESRAGYSVSIALVSREGIPYIGVIYDPCSHTLYHAIRGVGACRNEKSWQPDLTAGEPGERIDYGGAVMNAIMVLENPSYYYSNNPKPQNGGGCVWDYAAVACLYHTLGAWASDMYGEPLELNRKESLFMNHKGVLFAVNEEVAKSRMLIKT